jgi:uncharacterized membrane protein YgcG
MSLSSRNKYISEKRWSPLVVIIIFAAVGAYIVIRSNAYTGPPATLEDLARRTVATIAVDSVEQAADHAANDVFELKVNFASVALQGTEPRQVVLALSSHSGYVQYLGYTCAPTYACSDNSTYSRQVGDGMVHHRLNALVCLDVPLGTYYGSQHILTIRYKSLQQFPRTNPGDWFTITNGVAFGTCQSTPNPDVISWRSTYGQCGGPEDAGDPSQQDGTGAPYILCDTGSDIGTNRGGQNPGGTANTGLGDGSSSGGGGSSAKTQSSKPNTVPSSTSQGVETQQPELEASPFYDGKQYAPGSDPIDEKFGNISVGGRKIAHGWVYILSGLFVVGSIGGTTWWRWRRIT